MHFIWSDDTWFDDKLLIFSTSVASATTKEHKKNLSAFLCLSAHKAVNAHEASVIPLVHCMVNTVRSAPVMRECRAVLITHSGSEDLCQSHRAHFIEPQRQHNPSHLPLCVFFCPCACTTTWSILKVLISPPASMYQPSYLCKSICCENEACLMFWTLLDFMPFYPGNARIMKM